MEAVGPPVGWGDLPHPKPAKPAAKQANLG